MDVECLWTVVIMNAPYPGVAMIGDQMFDVYKVVILASGGVGPKQMRYGVCVA